MDWIDRMNAAVAYIEEHLTEDFDVEEAAAIAHCSSYHFQRIFGAMASVTVAEYVRRRRMSLAVADLRGGLSILDVAIKYGYSSPTSFNRAFQSVHGIPPSLAKLDGVTVKSFTPISFTVTVTGRGQLNYRIEDKPTFRVLGISTPLDMEGDPEMGGLYQFWEAAESSGLTAQIAALNDTGPRGLLGVMTGDDDLVDWQYCLATASTQPASEPLEELIVEAATWAIFPFEGGPKTIGALWERIIKEWMPTSGYEYTRGPEIEAYLGDTPSVEKYEIWIPITPASPDR